MNIPFECQTQSNFLIAVEEKSRVKYPCFTSINFILEFMLLIAISKGLHGNDNTYSRTENPKKYFVANSVRNYWFHCDLVTDLT